MELCSERLANISGMAHFKSILSQLGGKKKYPILTTYLPTANGGILPAKFASKLLEELSCLEKDKTLEEKLYLTQLPNNQLIASVNASSHVLFVFTPYNKFHYGISESGFFIIRNEPTHNGTPFPFVMFSSKHFDQHKLNENEYLFIDKESEASFNCVSGIEMDKENNDLTSEFILKKKKVAIITEYNYMIEPLKNLAKASIATGNPIHWC